MEARVCDQGGTGQPPSPENPTAHACPDLHPPSPTTQHVQPQDAYGLEKLCSEELCKHYSADFSIECRIARFHNIYGPYGTWKGGREKAPAAFCRKVCCVCR